MSINFLTENCKHSSRNKKFGLCDLVDADGNTGAPAYIDNANRENWIATVLNDYEEDIYFYAIDNCVNFTAQVKKCDGVLILNDKIAFVELKSRTGKASQWISEAEEQLRTTINHFIQENDTTAYTDKRAYIANNKSPRSRVSQAERMDRFYQTTGYVLFIEARINLYG